GHEQGVISEAFHLPAVPHELVARPEAEQVGAETEGAHWPTLQLPGSCWPAALLTAERLTPIRGPPGLVRRSLNWVAAQDLRFWPAAAGLPRPPSPRPAGGPWSV